MRLDYLPCLFIHIYLSSALPTAEAGIFVACALHVWMQSRIYVKKCRQASRINLLPFQILSFPSPPQYLKVQNTPRAKIACSLSAAITASHCFSYTWRQKALFGKCCHHQQHFSSELVPAHQQELLLHFHWGSVPAWPTGNPRYRLHTANCSAFEICSQQLAPCSSFAQLQAFWLQLLFWKNWIFPPAKATSLLYFKLRHSFNQLVGFLICLQPLWKSHRVLVLLCFCSSEPFWSSHLLYQSNQSLLCQNTRLELSPTTDYTESSRSVMNSKTERPFFTSHILGAWLCSVARAVQQIPFVILLSEKK